MRRTLKPLLTKPHDFNVFWHQTQAALTRLSPAVDRHPVSHATDPDLVLEQLSFESLGGAPIGAYLLRWRGETHRPLVVHAHGYGSACDVAWNWARAGLNVIGVDIRGYGRSAAALPHPAKWGYVLTGAESPETSVLRGAVCDYIRAVQVGRLILGKCTQRTILHGASFAGGLALMAEAVTHTADLLVVAVPTFGWAEGRHFFVKSGSGDQISRFLAERPESAEDLMLVLRYFDPMNFAGEVTCPTLVGVGLSDQVVPAKTVYAVANHLGGPFEIEEFPVSHTELPEERLWKRFEDRWIQLAMEGVPPSFGTRTDVTPS